LLVLVLPVMQAGVDTFMNRIKGLEGDKSLLEEQLKRTQQSVTCLQVRNITPHVAWLLGRGHKIVAVAAQQLCAFCPNGCCACLSTECLFEKPLCNSTGTNSICRQQ
jgi:hypothetical protein